ncbi:WXG100 family type VII secretion target [Mycolicibacterium sp.]|uniref:WXG100 family type VII secretion target n=1 Tax=Mycolicibacterium sp. TaxID=2320850 RepID=UPI0037C54A97
MSDARTYDLPAMQQFVEDVDRQIGILVQMHEEARSSARTVRTALTGMTGEAFDTKQAQWQRAGEERLEELRAMRDRVATAAKNYEDAERANSTMFQDV